MFKDKCQYAFNQIISIIKILPLFSSIPLFPNVFISNFLFNFFNFDGKNNCFKLSQLLKAFFPIDIKEDDNDICVNDIHPSNVLSLIEVTVDGIDICFNDEKPENEFSTIDFVVDVIVTCSISLIISFGISVFLNIDTLINNSFDNFLCNI